MASVAEHPSSAALSPSCPRTISNSTQASIDPVVLAAATVLRLQTNVSRELAATEAAVITIGAWHAGTNENVIPDESLIKLNVRTFEEGVRRAY